MIKIALTIIFFVSTVLGGFYIVHPVFENYKRQEQENEVLREELENIIVYVNELKKIEKEIEKNRENFEIIRYAFPEDHDAPNLFLYLQDMLENEKIETLRNLGPFSTRSYRDHSRIKEVSFDLTLIGEYQNIKSFFREIEKLARIINIKRVEIAYDSFDVEKDEDALEINITASTYSY